MSFAPAKTIGDEPIKFVTPTFGGVLGAAQLSTACAIWRRSSGIDVGLIGAVTPDFLWSVPMGAFLGASLCWACLWLKERPEAWQEWRGAFLRSVILGFVVAPVAPACLGLGNQNAAQLWEGFTVIYSVGWVFICAATQTERISKRAARS